MTVLLSTTVTCYALHDLDLRISNSLHCDINTLPWHYIIIIITAFVTFYALRDLDLRISNSLHCNINTLPWHYIIIVAAFTEN